MDAGPDPVGEGGPSAINVAHAHGRHDADSLSPGRFTEGSP